MSVPGARPSPRSIRPGWSASSSRNASAMRSGAWFSSITRPAPTRMVRVCAATWAIMISGDPLASPIAVVVLGEPVARVAQPLRHLRQLRRVAQRHRRGRAGLDLAEIKERERESHRGLLDSVTGRRGRRARSGARQTTRTAPCGPSRRVIGRATRESPGRHRGMVRPQPARIRGLSPVHADAGARVAIPVRVVHLTAASAVVRTTRNGSSRAWGAARKPMPSSPPRQGVVGRSRTRRRAPRRPDGPRRVGIGPVPDGGSQGRAMRVTPSFRWLGAGDGRCRPAAGCGPAWSDTVGPHNAPGQAS